VLAYLISEPELSTAGPLDDTLDVDHQEASLIGALAYDAAPHADDHRWIPARRRPSTTAAVPLA
jgi:hypothetical protein